MTDTFTLTVIPSQAGIRAHTPPATQWDNKQNMVLSATRNLYSKLDSRLRGNDEVVECAGFYTRLKRYLRLWQAYKGTGEFS